MQAHSSHVEGCDYKPGSIIEWGYDIPRYEPGKSGFRHVLVRVSHIEITAKVERSARRGKEREVYARVTGVQGWPFHPRHVRSLPEINRAFRKEHGMSLWGLSPAIRGYPVYRHKNVEEAFIPVDPVKRLLELKAPELAFENPTFILDACPRCGGAVHMNCDQWGEVLTCMSCGGLN